MWIIVTLAQIFNLIYNKLIIFETEDLDCARWIFDSIENPDNVGLNISLNLDMIIQIIRLEEMERLIILATSNDEVAVILLIFVSVLHDVLNLLLTNLR